MDKLQKLLDSFCGKDAHDIDVKNSVVEAADQNISATSHNEEPQAAKSDSVDLTVSPEKKHLKIDSPHCDHDCDMEKNILDGNKLTDIPINKGLGIIKQQFPRVTVNIVAV